MKNINTSVAYFLCESATFCLEIKTKFFDVPTLREDEEWLHYRKILNNLVLKDFSRFKVGIERACDKFLLNIETKVYAYPPQSYIQLDALEKDLYRWSIDGNNDCISSKHQFKKNVSAFSSTFKCHDWC